MKVVVLLLAVVAAVVTAVVVATLLCVIWPLSSHQKSKSLLFVTESISREIGLSWL